MITLNDLFKYSIVISRQQSRIDLMKMSFTVAGLPLPTVHMEPVRICHNNTDSCKKTHCKAVKYAMENDWPYVLIFEDDAYPRSDAKIKLEQILPSINFNIMPLIALGYTSVNFATNDISNNFFKRINGLVGFHSYIVHKSCFSRYAKGFDGKHIDIIISRNAQKIFGYPMYATTDYLFIQYTEENEPNVDRRDYFENRHGYAINGIYRNSTDANMLFNEKENIIKMFNSMYKLSDFSIPTVYADII